MLSQTSTVLHSLGFITSTGKIWGVIGVKIRCCFEGSKWLSVPALRYANFVSALFKTMILHCRIDLAIMWSSIRVAVLLFDGVWRFPYLRRKSNEWHLHNFVSSTLPIECWLFMFDSNIRFLEKRSTCLWKIESCKLQQISTKQAKKKGLVYPSNSVLSFVWKCTHQV